MMIFIAFVGSNKIAVKESKPGRETVAVFSHFSTRIPGTLANVETIKLSKSGDVAWWLGGWGRQKGSPEQK